MRHVLSLVLALVLAPVIYLSAGISAAKFDEALSSDARELGAAGLGLAAALLAGGLYAVLVMARLSPVGPVLAGLLYLGVTVWAMLDTGGLRRLFPDALLGVEGAFSRPVTAGAALLAVPLLATVFSPRRWRSNPDSALPGYDAAPAYPPPPDTAAPAYVPLGSDFPSYQPPVYTPPSSPTASLQQTLDLPRHDA